MSALAERVSNWRTAIGVTAALVALVLFGAAIVGKDQPKHPNLLADQAALGRIILRDFEREAFRNEDFQAEDLRALFSACNETRQALSLDINQLTTAALDKLIRTIISDLKEVSKLSPWPESETGIKPDRRGERCLSDKAFVAEWFLKKGGEQQLAGVLDRRLAIYGSTNDERANQVYTALQQEVWTRLEPSRAAYLCLQRIKA